MNQVVVVAVVIALGCSGKDSRDEKREANQQKQREMDAACKQDPWSDRCAQLRAALPKAEPAAAGDPCGDGAKERQTWVDTASEELSGYAPATFHMRPTGQCGTTLRVKEDDCSLAHLGEAYGVKPFMQTARRLGARRSRAATTSSTSQL